MNNIASTASLRPRARRRTDSEEHDGPSAKHQVPRTLVSQFERSLSRSRPEELEDRKSGTAREYRGSQNSVSLWDSPWSSIQNLASDLFGGEASRSSSPGGSPRRRRITGNGATSRWGPSSTRTDRTLGTGTEERRRREVEAKRRERLLGADAHTSSDGLGRFKRRGSDEMDRPYRDSLSTSLPPSETDDRDTLVYIHNVTPADTLAGVTIKYNCAVNTFQRVNRLWPNDSIQVRKIVVLPVDACALRGQKVPGPAAEGNPTPNGRAHDLDDTLSSGSAWSHWSLGSRAGQSSKTNDSSNTTSPIPSCSRSEADEPPWQHDSWILLDGFPRAIEVARMSRRTLGYFPRSRRKSQSLGSPSPPTTSLDLTRPNNSHPLRTRPSLPQIQEQSFLNLAPYPHDNLQHARPGGVGTMARNVRKPGPANDGLNKLFPNLLEPGVSGTPNGSSSTGSLEGWVRRISSSITNAPGLSLATTIVHRSDPQIDLVRPALNFRDRSPVASRGRVQTGGELIELSEDAFT